MKNDNKVTQIVYPLHPRGGKLRNDTELRYSLRSLEKHFKGSYEVTIVGPKLPEWIQGVGQIKHKEGLKSALVAAAAAYPDGFVWLYDDCCLLRDMTVDDMKLTPANKGIGGARTRWAQGLVTIRERLKEEGLPQMDYSRPHGPYWFDKSMIDESFEDWPGMKGKFPFETWILNKRAWPYRRNAVKQYYHSYKGPPAAGKWWFLNYNDNGNTPQLRQWLTSNFAVSSKFESAGFEGSQPGSQTVSMTIEQRVERLERMQGINDNGRVLVANTQGARQDNRVARVKLRPKGG